MPERRSFAFLLIYGIANIGGVVAYMPLLSLLLPVKVEAIAGAGRLGVFTACVVAGGVAAALSNILFGWLSDRSLAHGKGRRRWMLAGLVALAAALTGIVAAASPYAIVAAIVAFQIAVNILLAPLLAIMADEIPDAQKGVASGLLSLGRPVAAALSAALVALPLIGEGARLLLVLLAVIVCVLPLMLVPARRVESAVPVAEQRYLLRYDLTMAWGARFLIQVAGAVLSVYLLYYFQSLSNEPAETMAARVGNVFTIAYLLPVPIALAIGRASDRIGRRKPFLLATAAVAAIGLGGMALAQDWIAGAVAFCVYASGAEAFLALHAGFAMQLLPDPRHRGRDLGILNLTNTLPSVLGPVIPWLLATPHDFDSAMLALAACALAGGLLILTVRGRR
ncbi:MFS transporter [Stakelama sediminis]|uniref:MFS transporter n=1 Tax=Stakelama sediminis TaxID=463200 RepID=UPI0031B59886